MSHLIVWMLELFPTKYSFVCSNTLVVSNLWINIQWFFKSCNVPNIVPQFFVKIHVCMPCFIKLWFFKWTSVIKLESHMLHLKVPPDFELAPPEFDLSWRFSMIRSFTRLDWSCAPIWSALPWSWIWAWVLNSRMVLKDFWHAVQVETVELSFCEILLTILEG